MTKRAFVPEDIFRSVLAVPPLARRQDFAVSRRENYKLIRYLCKGGVQTLLYGGNANFYHQGVGDYSALLRFLVESVAEDVCLVPSVGPAFGTMMDQARILREFDFPTAMVLPAGFPSTPAGIELGIREFSDRSGMAVLLYIKQENYLSAAQVRSLVEDRTVCAIKYAVVRENPAEDPYLRSLVDAVDPRIVISGIGEQPAIVHMRDFGLAGFTSGCVCIAPGRSMQMLRAIQRRDWETADRIRLRFAPLEDLRNRFGPIPVLHQAVSLARIAETGPILPLMTNLSKDLWQSVAETSIELSEYEKTRAMETAGQEEVTSAPRDAGA